MQIRNPKEIKLIGITHTQDDIGQDIETKSTSTVLADIYSISSSYREEAAQRGVFLEWNCLVWNFEYSEQQYVEIDNVTYKVNSTYYQEDGKVELRLERASGLDVEEVGNG